MSDNDCKCGKCGGSGVIPHEARTFGGKAAVGWQTFCDVCRGTGRKPEKPVQSLQSGEIADTLHEISGKQKRQTAQRCGKRAIIR